MKLRNLFYFFLIPALTLALVACDDDDDNNNSVDIVGTWTFEKFIEPNARTSNQALTEAIKQHIQDSVINGTQRGNLFVESRIFNANGTFEEHGFVIMHKNPDEPINFEYEGKYTINGGAVLIDCASAWHFHSGIKTSGNSDVKNDESPFNRIYPVNGVYTERLYCHDLYINDDSKLNKEMFDKLLADYPETMKPLANLTDEDIQKLEVYDAYVEMIYKKN